MKRNRKKVENNVRKVNLREYIEEQTKTGAQDEVSMDEKIGALLDAELLKSADKMDMDLIREGLNYFYPFDEEADRATAEESYQRFLEKYDPFGDRRKKRITPRRIIVVAAALVVLLVTGVCYALGINLWKVAYEWVQDSLFLKIEYNGEQSTEKSSTTYATEIWGEALYELMEEHGISVDLPTWMPEEMECEYVEANLSTGSVQNIFARYVTGEENVICLMITNYKDIGEISLPEVYAETDTNIREVVTNTDNTYYVASNIDESFIMWIDGCSTIRLSGNWNNEEIINIIKILEG